MGEGDLQRSVEESLGKLRVSQVDLLLLHWPNPAIPLAESVRALNEVKRSGLTRHIGLSNFTSAMLAEAWRLTPSPSPRSRSSTIPTSTRPPCATPCARAPWP